MSKEFKATVREFANSLSDSELLFVTTRLADRFVGDLADALDFLSKHKNIDALLSTTHSADEFYETVDQITDVLRQECDKKGLFGTVAA